MWLDTVLNQETIPNWGKTEEGLGLEWSPIALRVCSLLASIKKTYRLGELFSQPGHLHVQSVH